jgi:quercetin dioxygenase-like cupin family protein
MPFIQESRESGELMGARDGLRHLMVLIQPVAPDEVAYLHRHDGGDQVLRVVSGALLVQIGDETRHCVAGEIAVVPAGETHGFRGTGAPALLEVIGQQGCGTTFAVRGEDGAVEWVEVHRPEWAWDRPGEPTDFEALCERAISPRLAP